MTIRDDIEALRTVGRTEVIRLGEEDEALQLALITNTMWEAINMLADAVDRLDPK